MLKPILLASALLVTQGCSAIASPIETMKAPVAAAHQKAKVVNFAKLIPAGAKVVKVSSVTKELKTSVAIDVTGDGKVEHIAGYRLNDKKVGIIVADANGKVVAHEQFAIDGIFAGTFNIKPASLTGTKAQQAVVTFDVNAGNYTDSTVAVLGLKGKQVQSLYRQTGIINGAVTLAKGSFTVESRGVAKQYKWNGKTFASQVVKGDQTVKQGEVAVRYSMTKSGKMTVSANKVTVKVGQVVKFIREDALDVQERIMTEGDISPVLLLGANNTYRALKPGTAKFTIVPNGGYDWDHAQDITVTIVK